MGKRQQTETWQTPQAPTQPPAHPAGLSAARPAKQAAAPTPAQAAACPAAQPDAQPAAHPAAPPFDMHCHLGFAVNAAALAESFAQAGGGALCCTVEPDEHERLARILPQGDAVRLGVGLHPWWLANGRCGEPDVQRFEQLAEQAGFIGEVGLDFGPRNVASSDAQLAAFERICSVAAREGGKVMSIHSVKAAKEVLDVLERTGCVSAERGRASCACILHWYSGPSDQLTRAIKLGCYFSVGERALATRRGREYARIVPADRLLLETDLPEQACNVYDFARIEASLSRAISGIEEVRGASMAEAIRRNSQRILGLAGA